MSNDFTQDIPYQIAYDAHRGTSFVPEKRAQSIIEGWTADMTQVQTKVLELAGADRADEAEAAFQAFRQDMLRRYLTVLRYRSNLMSTMIAGPSNFPVERQRKKNERDHKLTGEFLEAWKVAEKRLYAAFLPVEARGAEPIRTGDAGAVDALKEKLARLKERQEHMKAINALIRKYMKEGTEAEVTALIVYGEPEPLARALVQNRGFAHFEITNNGANIRRVEDQLVKAESLARSETKEIMIGEVRIVDNKEEDRLQMFFPVERVSRPIWEMLSSHGFRHSRTNGCFQAYRGNNANYWAPIIAAEYGKSA